MDHLNWLRTHIDVHHNGLLGKPLGPKSNIIHELLFLKIKQTKYIFKNKFINATKHIQKSNKITQCI